MNKQAADAELVYDLRHLLDPLTPPAASVCRFAFP